MKWTDVLIFVLCGYLAIRLYRFVKQHLEPEESVYLQGHIAMAQTALEDDGYRVLRGSKTGRCTGYLDDMAYRRNFSADCIVRKDAKDYAVFVISSETDPDERLITEWLPCCLSLGVDGILFVDIHKGKVHALDFEFTRPRRAALRRLYPHLASLCSGFVFAVFLMHG